MIFTIQAQEMFFEIDLTSFISTVNQVKNQINLSNNKTEFGTKKFVEGLNKTLTSSLIKIKKRKFRSSLNYTNITDVKLVEGKKGIYLIFSVIEGNKKYTYDFKIMNKISYNIEKNYIFFNSYEVILDEVSLRKEVIEKTLSNGIRTYYTIKKIGLFLNLKLVGIFTLIISLFGFGIANAFAYLGI